MKKFTRGGSPVSGPESRPFEPDQDSRIFGDACVGK
jgi:hypothetical protein